MAFDGEGTIYIPLEDFWTFATKYGPTFPGGGAEIRFGIPRVNKGAGDMEISYAMSNTEVAPEDWQKKPQALKEWEEAK